MASSPQRRACSTGAGAERGRDGIIPSAACMRICTHTKHWQGRHHANSSGGSQLSLRGKGQAVWEMQSRNKPVTKRADCVGLALPTTAAVGGARGQ